MTEPERTEDERAALGVNVAATAEAAHAQHRATPLAREAIFNLHDVNVSYGGARAVADVSMDIYAKHITALIGPSGCGKSTLIRCLNRMNDLIPAAEVTGAIDYHGYNLY